MPKSFQLRGLPVLFLYEMFIARSAAACVLKETHRINSSSIIWNATSNYNSTKCCLTICVALKLQTRHCGIFLLHKMTGLWLLNGTMILPTPASMPHTQGNESGSLKSDFPTFVGEKGKIIRRMRWVSICVCLVCPIQRQRPTLLSHDYVLFYYISKAGLKTGLMSFLMEKPPKNFSCLY